tara:strand:- start:11290 stop:11430 length:141 start_codon:yes stop_codon:yes gene_type:complete
MTEKIIEPISLLSNMDGFYCQNVLGFVEGRLQTLEFVVKLEKFKQN